MAELGTKGETLLSKYPCLLSCSCLNYMYHVLSVVPHSVSSYSGLICLHYLSHFRASADCRNYHSSINYQAATPRGWVVAVSRYWNEVVNFELTPFGGYRWCEHMLRIWERPAYCSKRAEWPLTCVTPPNLSWKEVNEAYWGEGR